MTKKSKEILQALSIYINQLVYDQKRLGRDITVLSLGEAFFDIPKMPFDKLDMNKGYHYSDSMGLPNLRKKISNYYTKHFQAKINPLTNIIISAGSKILLYLAIKSLIKKNDDITIIEPYWLSYVEQIKMCGGNAISVPYQKNIEKVSNYLTKNTRAIIINNPNNPSGEYYKKKDIKKLLSICNERNIKIIIDETYNDFVREKYYSLSQEKNKENIIIINSLSKNMGLSGWRLGFLISNEKFIKEILKLNQHLITCAPTILQMYVEKYFDIILKYTKPQINDLLKKRDKIQEYLDSIGLDYMKGNSTFYFMINVKKFTKSTYFFSIYLLLKYQISVVPGEAYGKGCIDYIRLSIGSESIERIFQALDTIKLLIEEDQFDKDLIQLIKEKYNYEN